MSDDETPEAKNRIEIILPRAPWRPRRSAPGRPARGLPVPLRWDEVAIFVRSYQTYLDLMGALMHLPLGWANEPARQLLEAARLERQAGIEGVVVEW